MSAIPTGVPPLPPVPPHATEGSGLQLPGPHPVLAPVNDPRVLPLDRPVTLAGSGPRCRLNLRSSTVSKVHAIFIRDGATVYVRDLASREGVKVDGEAVRECLLAGGEKITIGRFEFIFEAVASSRLPRRAPAGSLQGIEIESRTFLIGRRNTADLVIDHDSVSSAHALLLEYNGRRYLRDLGSRTGVLLNGHRVQWECLKSGDVICVGGEELVYVEAEPLRFEPRMRLSTPTGGVVLGPGGSVEQATFLSENLSDQLSGVSVDDSVSGSVEATAADSAAAIEFESGSVRTASAQDAAGPIGPTAPMGDGAAQPPAVAIVGDDPTTPWGTVAGGVAFDDGTASDTHAGETTEGGERPSEPFSKLGLPVADESGGVERVVSTASEPMTQQAADGPVRSEPTDLKPSPLPFDPLAAYGQPTLSPSTPPADVGLHGPAGAASEAVDAQRTHPAQVANAPGTPAPPDAFESLLAGLDVAPASEPPAASTGEAKATGVSAERFSGFRQAEPEDVRAFAPPPVDVSDGITLELSFDDVETPGEPVTPPRTAVPAEPSARPQEAPAVVPAQDTALSAPPEPSEANSKASTSLLGDSAADHQPPGVATKSAEENTPTATWPVLTAPDSPLVSAGSRLRVTAAGSPGTEALSDQSARSSDSTEGGAGRAAVGGLVAGAGPMSGFGPGSGSGSVLGGGRVTHAGREVDTDVGPLSQATRADVTGEDGREPVARGWVRWVATVIRWLLIGGLVAAAAYGGWSLAAPVTMVSASVRLPPGVTSASVLTAEPVRLRAVARLAEVDPALSPGVLQNQALLQAWADSASVEGGTLILRVVGDREDARRAEALLWAVAFQASRPDVPPETIGAARQEQVVAAEQALAAAEKRLSDTRARLADAEALAGLAAEVRAAEKHRDQVAARLETLRTSQPPTDDAARKTLDAAVASFQSQLEAARSQPSADERLSRFVAAVQRVQEQGQRLMDEILASREEQARRLQSLRRRLDERMRVRQQQAWDNDATLQRLVAEHEATRRRLNEARERNDVTAATDLAGELAYYEGLIKSRRALVGTDRGDERALAELQSIIEEQQRATEADRQRLAEGFESMRQTIVGTLPELAGLPDAEFKLAADLEARLTELQTARANLTEAAAAAAAKHQQTLAQLETELESANAKLVELGQRLEETRTQQPSAHELAELEQRVERARETVRLARQALDAPESAFEATDPEIALVWSDASYRPYVAAGSGFVALLLLSPLLRSRRSLDPDAV